MSVARRALRTVLLALGFAFAIGFGAGSWMRCQMEQAPSYIGDTRDAPPTRAGA
jgi:TRAP-type C4-dicarboxylate transport system permease small subunit